MRLSKYHLRFIAPIALLAASACTTPFRADVARFQQMPAAQGQSFIVQPETAEEPAGLEFDTYAGLVAAELQERGYVQASSADAATLIVTMDYMVDNGRERIVSRPGYRPFFYDPFYHRGFWRSRYYYGWYDPFFDSAFGYPDVRSYTLYTSELELDIRRAGDGKAVFEGRARARSRNDNLTELIPNLVEAMFTDFPGNSGEEVRITVMPRDES